MQPEFRITKNWPSGQAEATNKTTLSIARLVQERNGTVSLLTFSKTT